MAMKKRISKRVRLLFVMLAVIAVECVLYIAKWQPEMEALYVIGTELKEQDAGRWLKPLVREMECFPVRKDITGKIYWGYDNGYGEGRSYGGARRHEGIDIMSSSQERGQLLVQSVSNGVVEQLGWLELGGYRVGIRSPSGLYFYYAHLDSYADGLKKGDTVQAGQLLGYMGDSGYGEEGTRGKFAVHLHFGIYYTEQGKEKSLNPFYLLQYKECGRIHIRAESHDEATVLMNGVT